ncbi:IS630 family transposase [Algiphilus sp.]|uniref:IS630 family transposase n=1 Tax=Algiphilus sp. TaxID=1872431 RepID=UPI0025C61FB0|nr:IS630 family transposase [Algiphilus sp.]MCK5770178.1 IS630 family transposase [Algiphilus sp.]
MARARRSLDITGEEREQLDAIAASRSLPAALVRRAKIVLLTEDGLSDREAARHLDISQPTVSLWRRRFRTGRIAGLHDEMKPGRPRTQDDDQVAQLLNTVLSTQPDAGTHWSVRTLADSTGMSKSTVQRYLALFGVQPHRSQSFKLSNDPFFIEKVRDIVGLYLDPPHNAMVLCVDEKSQCQALERTQPVLPLGLGYVEGVTHDYVRHGTTTLFAALDVATGEVMTQCKKRHRHQEYLSFLRHIDQNVPANLDIHLVVDNYATHKHPKVRAWLAKRPRYHVHYTPTYASWLNQVERWFGLITQKAICRGSFKSVPDLVKRIERYVEHYNTNARPFVWTATAQSIIDKIERVCKVINGTTH